jgi:cytochrome c-type biogenesis protein CcmH/NrfF
MIGIGVVLSGVPAWSQTVPLNPAQLESYHRLTQQLIAPCCWREPIAIHRSPEAVQMLEEVQQSLVEGRSEDEIRSLYVDRYGDRILADPPGLTGHWLYVVPVAIFVGLFWLAVRRLRVLVRTAPIPAPAASPEFLALVRKETNKDWI